MIYFKEENFEKYKRMLKRSKIPFDLYENNISSRISDGYAADKFTGPQISRRYLSFISRVKNHVSKKIEEGKLKPNLKKFFDTKYFGVSFNENITLKNCYEIDINSAYWETAFKLNIISPEIYKEGNKITEISKDDTLSKKTRDEAKSVRLMALGSLAKKTAHFRFDGKKMHRMPDIEDKNTTYYWNEICFNTAKLMKQCSFKAEDDYLFYWVDAIFIKGEKLEEIKKFITDNGYEYKIKKIKKVTFKKGEIEADGKIFSISSKKINYV